MTTIRKGVRKPRPRKSKANVCSAKGGPYDGWLLEFGAGGTLSFSVRGYTGSYDSNGKWTEKA